MWRHQLLLATLCLAACGRRNDSIGNADARAGATTAAPAIVALDGGAKELVETRLACTRGQASACTRFGALNQVGAYGDREFPLAQWGFEQGCNLGDGAGCRLLGMMHLYGNGMVRDEPGARKLIAQGCKDGDKEACHLVKAMGM